MPETQIEILRTLREVDALADEWRSLWRADPLATPFQSPEWLLPWLHQFGHRDLRIVTIRRAGALTALIPFFLYADPRTQKRQLLLVGVGTSDYLGGVFHPTCTVADVRRAMHLLQAEPGWDELCVAQQRSESLLLQSAGEHSVFPTEGCSRTPALPIPELPPGIRRNVRYYRNLAQRSGTLELTIATAEDCVSAFEDLQRLHSERWLQEGQSGVLADPRVVAWHRQALPQLARPGLLRLSSLRLEGQTIAVAYCLVDPPDRPHRTQYFYLPGFSPRFAKLRPGTVLQALVMQHAAEEGVVMFDLLRGEESYKKLWHPEQMPTYGFLRPATSNLQPLEDAA